MSLTILSNTLYSLSLMSPELRIFAKLVTNIPLFDYHIFSIIEECLYSQHPLYPNTKVQFIHQHTQTFSTKSQCIDQDLVPEKAIEYPITPQHQLEVFNCMPAWELSNTPRESPVWEHRDNTLHKHIPENCCVYALNRYGPQNIPPNNPLEDDGIPFQRNIMSVCGYHNILDPTFDLLGACSHIVPLCFISYVRMLHVFKPTPEARVTDWKHHNKVSTDPCCTCYVRMMCYDRKGNLRAQLTQHVCTIQQALRQNIFKMYRTIKYKDQMYNACQSFVFGTQMSYYMFCLHCRAFPDGQYYNPVSETQTEDHKLYLFPITKEQEIRIHTSVYFGCLKY